MLAMTEGVMIANAIDTAPERLAFLMVEKNVECEFREWQTQLRVRKLGVVRLLGHRPYLGERDIQQYKFCGNGESGAIP